MICETFHGNPFIGSEKLQKEKCFSLPDFFPCCCWWWWCCSLSFFLLFIRPPLRWRDAPDGGPLASSLPLALLVLDLLPCVLFFCVLIGSDRTGTGLARFYWVSVKRIWQGCTYCRPVCCRGSPNGPYRVLPSFTGFYRVLPGFTGFLTGFTEFYWVLLGFIGIYWALPGSTGFYWVLLGFTGLNWFWLFSGYILFFFWVFTGFCWVSLS